LNTLWFEYIKTVTNSHLYNPHSSVFQRLLNNLQNGQISEASMIRRFIYCFLFLFDEIFFCVGEMPQGTQIKIILDLSNGIQGLLKPYRF
jgi:hypothetical protein